MPPTVKVPDFLHRCLRRLAWACLLSLGLWLHAANAESIVHQGPVLDIQVQRGEQRLPLFLVPQLRRGDRLLVRPQADSMAKGDWILMLGLISPAGNQVRTRAVDPARLEDFATLDIDADEQAPVIVLAPQLRNLFGLYTSFVESGALLDQVIQSDPQRFHDLQRLDEVNQAISALAQGLDQLVLSRNPSEAIAAARALALRFGVSQVDPECFRNNAVNTQCVAVNIVANKDFVLPSSSELGLLAGGKNMADLTGFITEKVKVFSEAGDFLSHKFRDQYDFAATFGRRQGDSGLTRLYSLTRFRQGSIKTAYVYVPAWFTGKPPTLSPDAGRPLCLTAGRLEVRTSDRMPVVNHWHGWTMTFTDPASGALLGQAEQVSFASERGVFDFRAPASVSAHTGALVTATLQGRFGFEPAALAPLPLVVPPADIAAGLQGHNELVSGETAELQLPPPQAACVQTLELVRDRTVLARSSAEQPARVAVDLTRTTPGPVALRAELQGAPAQSLALRVLPPRARIDAVEHTELEEDLLVSGQRLERIARLQLGSTRCTPAGPPTVTDAQAAQEQLRMLCDANIRRNASLPANAVLHHSGDEPPPLQALLRKNAAPPRVRVSSAANALLVRPSVKAQRWGLTPARKLLSDDAGLSVLLQAVDGYTLGKGSYTLQLRFADDPATTRSPISAALMADLANQELRTRQPVRLKGVELPTVINPLEYRVLHSPSGLAGPWTPLQYAVLMLPQLGALDCAATPGHWWLHGSQLDLIDDARWASTPMAGTQTGNGPQLQACPDGLCLLLPQTPTPERLTVQLHWLAQETFSVDVGNGPACNGP
jgi:hypothetical protein